VATSPPPQPTFIAYDHKFPARRVEPVMYRKHGIVENIRLKMELSETTRDNENATVSNFETGKTGPLPFGNLMNRVWGEG